VNRPILRVTQTGSPIVTAITLGALIWTVYQAGGRRRGSAA
jgi:hypothetical protein